MQHEVEKTPRRASRSLKSGGSTVTSGNVSGLPRRIADSLSSSNQAYKNSSLTSFTTDRDPADDLKESTLRVSPTDQHDVYDSHGTAYTFKRDHSSCRLRGLYTTSNMEYGVPKTSKNVVRAGLSSYVGTICKESTLERVFH